MAFEGEFDPEKERESLKNKKEPEHPGRLGERLRRGLCWAASTSPLSQSGLTDTMCRWAVSAASPPCPPYRRKGVIRACMQSAFQSMYQEGCAFPSSTPSAPLITDSSALKTEPPVRPGRCPSSLKLPDAGGAIEQLFPGDDLSPLLEIYNSYYKNFNLPYYGMVTMLLWKRKTG